MKTNTAVKGRRSLGKKKDDKADNKSEESQDELEEGGNEKNPESTDAETSNPKPTTSRRSGRKRQLSDGADAEEEGDSEKKDDTEGDNEAEKEDSTEDDDKDGKKDENEDKPESDKSELKNGKTEGPSKSKAKKKRRPPIKKKKVEQDESEMWTPLEPLDGDEKKDAQKKTQSKSDRRKQALVERQAPAEPMLQKQPPRQRRNSDANECVVLGSVSRNQRRSKTIVTVDIDDEASETGSIQIVAEPDVDSVFDFKRLLIQYRNVNLPSSLWGVHKDPRSEFVSFTRFNPDYPETNGVIVDRAVVFKGCLNPEAFINGEKIELPEMFNVVETSYEASQVVQFVNNTVVPPPLPSHPPEEPSEATCSEDF